MLLILALTIVVPAVYFVSILTNLFINWQVERFNNKVDREND